MGSEMCIRDRSRYVDVPTEDTTVRGQHVSSYTRILEHFGLPHMQYSSEAVATGDGGPSVPPQPLDPAAAEEAGDSLSPLASEAIPSRLTSVAQSQELDPIKEANHSVLPRCRVEDEGDGRAALPVDQTSGKPILTNSMWLLPEIGEAPWEPLAPTAALLKKLHQLSDQEAVTARTMFTRILTLHARRTPYYKEQRSQEDHKREHLHKVVLSTDLIMGNLRWVIDNFMGPDEATRRPCPRAVREILVRLGFRYNLDDPVLFEPLDENNAPDVPELERSRWKLHRGFVDHTAVLFDDFYVSVMFTGSQVAALFLELFYATKEHTKYLILWVLRLSLIHI